jgi:hypothetical protein
MQSWGPWLFHQLSEEAMPLSKLSRISAAAMVLAVIAPLLVDRAAAQSAAPTPSPDASGQPDTPPPPVTGGLGGATTTVIRPVSLRAGPNSSYPVVGTLRPGMQLRVVATGSYGWTQVESPQGTGWAYGPGYLTPVTGALAADSPAPAPGPHGPVPEISSP